MGAGLLFGHMQLDLLRQSLSDFFRDLQAGWRSGLEPLYETVAAWQAHWPPPTPAALPATLDAALTNSQTRAFYQGHAYYPKEALLQLAETAPEMVNLAFGRLFREGEDLGDRFAAFTHYLDEVLGEVRRVHPRTKFNTHHHDDYRAPSLYCACRHPATHAYFEADVYLGALRALRAKDVGTVADPTRFAKTVKVIMTFARKEAACAKTQDARRDPTSPIYLGAGAYLEPSALLASEYFRYVSR